jgi:hypothetical protein
MMTSEEFIKFRNVEIKNETHRRIIAMFYKNFSSVSGDTRLLPDLIGELLNIDLSNTVAQTACFNGIHDGGVAPLEDVDLYIRFENDIRVYVYGTNSTTDAVTLQENEFIICVLTDSLFGKVNLANNGHTYILE